MHTAFCGSLFVGKGAEVEQGKAAEETFVIPYWGECG